MLKIFCYTAFLSFERAVIMIFIKYYAKTLDKVLIFARIFPINLV